MRTLVVISIILLCIGANVVTGFHTNSPNNPEPLDRNNWLYVGGSGPGNYTSIQSAINAASPGDTVFVYDDSSPYLETLVIPTSLSLIGENKQTTIIDGANTNDIVNITADNVTIMEFTLQNSNDSGVVINSNNNTITENIFHDVFYGVSTGRMSLSLGLHNNTIDNNRFIAIDAGVFFWYVWDTVITRNVFSHCDDAISMTISLNTNISFNIITQNFIGIWIMIGYHTIVYRNNISYNSRFGLYSGGTNADRIIQNNFIGNNESAVSSQWWIPELKLWRSLGLPYFRRNVWKGNYWDEPHIGPYMIPGLLFKLRFHFDWFPAQEPYDIPSLK